MCRIVAFILIFVGTYLSAQLTCSTTLPYIYVVNLNTGHVVHEKNSEELIYPASTTKIATALYVLSKKIDLDTVVTVKSKQSLARISPKKKAQNHFTDASYLLEYDGVFFGLKVGEEITLRNMLFALMLSSGNDVANVLAEFISGDIETFCCELNEFVKGLGLMRTHFMNPHGLHHPEHVSTPKDMVLLGKYALEHAFLKEVVSTSFYTIPETNKHVGRDIKQGNKLLREGAFRYPKAFGVKTGNHLRAGKCLVAAASDEHRLLLGGFFKGKDWRETYGDTIAIFDAGFREKPITRYLFRSGEASFFTTYKKEKIRSDLLQDVYIEYYPSEEPNLSTKLVWNELSLPIHRGDAIGKIRIYDGKVLLKEVPLNAYKEYKKERSFFLWGSLLIFGALSAYLLAVRRRALQTH